MRICPQPIIWNEVYKRLSKHASTHVCVPPQPPTPLVLAGWAYSNDTDKLHRWERMVEWANTNGCPEAVAGIPEDQFYCVESPTTYVVGPRGGPMYREWDFQQRSKPEAEVLNDLLKLLQSQWLNVAGPELAAITTPLRFAGPKGRRLVVNAKQSAFPPWGSWTELPLDEQKRRSFTRFRTAVNAAIAPHEVDHIDFETGGVSS